MKNPTDTFDLVKEWQSLERKARDVEFERIKFCRKLRGRFGPGKSGDREFKDWCIVNLRQTEPDADAMLTRAIAGGVFADAVEYKKAGGEHSIDCFDVSAPVTEREAAMRRAKKDSVKIKSAWGKMKHGEPTAKHNARGDASRLAEYLVRTKSTLPPEIREIVARYVALS